MTVTRRLRRNRAMGSRRRLCYRGPVIQGAGRVVTDRAIVVAGAGAIGCFVGGMLAAADRRVALLVRPRVKTEIERFGLRLTDFGGAEKKLDAGRLALYRPRCPSTRATPSADTSSTA